MTGLDAAQLIDRTGQLTIDKLTVPVTVRNAREVFGRVDVLVTVDGGSGEQWVGLDRVELT